VISISGWFDWGLFGITQATQAAAGQSTTTMSLHDEIDDVAKFIQHGVEHKMIRYNAVSGDIINPEVLDNVPLNIVDDARLKELQNENATLNERLDDLQSQLDAYNNNTSNPLGGIMSFLPILMLMMGMN
jgi:hypothetical protein